MPELPEIEIVKRSLFKIVNKAKIIKVIINNKNLRYKLPSSFSDKLINNTILSVSRRSKYLIFNLEKKILLVHLGMSGKLIIMKSSNSMSFCLQLFRPFLFVKRLLLLRFFFFLL